MSLKLKSHYVLFENISIGILATWLILSMMYFAFYLTVIKFEWRFVYYYIWLIVFGLPLWFFRKQVALVLQNWQAPDWLQFFLLAYGMVLLEEIFAALVNNLSEGFNVWLYLKRIGQFWAFNVLAFTGLITATWLLFRYIQYTQWDMLFLVGLTGLYSERIILLLPYQLQTFIVFAPLTFFTYALILYPALMNRKEGKLKRTLLLPLRYALFIVTWYVFSQPSVWLLMTLRSAFPLLFPPCNFIACG